jgi:anti-sigma factor RsiW
MNAPTVSPNMESHVTADLLNQLVHGDLGAADVAAVGRHIGTCAECVALSRGHVDADHFVSMIRGQFHDEWSEHPDLDSELFAYVDGTLDGAERGRIEDHLGGCLRCRQDVEDLAAEQKNLVRPAPWNGEWLAAAAILCVALLTGIAVVRSGVIGSHRQQPVPAVPVRVIRQERPTAAPHGKPEWDAFVREALARGSIARPAVIAGLRWSPDALRGTPSGAAAALTPAGVVVETDTPWFRWTGDERGATYDVSVYDGDRLIMRSPPLRERSWAATRALRRGHTYDWQVVQTSPGSRRVIPEPPAPPAQFTVMDAESWNEINEARRLVPEDHLLVALLFARAGVQSSARQELTQYLRDHPDDTRAAGLLESLDRW